MRTDDFIRELCKVTGEEYQDVYIRGRRAGWLEAEDELYPDRDISRKNVARILHMYLLKVRMVPDLPDISRASALKDLYDCRICANHVAQVYLRGLMDAKNLMKEGEFLWFDLDGVDEDAVVLSQIAEMKDVSCKAL